MKRRLVLRPTGTGQKLDAFFVRDLDGVLRVGGPNAKANNLSRIGGGSMTGNGLAGVVRISLARGVSAVASVIHPYTEPLHPGRMRRKLRISVPFLNTGFRQ